MTIDNMNFDNSCAEKHNAHKRNRAKTRKTNFKKKKQRMEIANRRRNPFAGVCCDVCNKEDNFVGSYIKFAGKSTKQKFLKGQSARRVRKTANIGNGNQYKKHYEYQWRLY